MLFVFVAYIGVQHPLNVYINNMAGVLIEAGNACPSPAHEFTHGFLVGLC